MKVKNFVLRDGRDVGAAHHAAPARALRPVQHGAAEEMSAAADQRYVRQEIERVAVPKFDRGIGPHHPVAVGRMQMDRHVAENAAPFHHRSVK